MIHTAAIQPSHNAPPIPLPAGYVGPILLPGTHRQVWWTGRVAIGLRYDPMREAAAPGASAEWLQTVMLRPSA